MSCFPANKGKTGKWIAGGEPGSESALVVERWQCVLDPTLLIVMKTEATNIQICSTSLIV